ncbi:MAG TPA: hypothetical protein VK835_07375 [Bacteroidia bacterium]|jgi:hypothetical protein|nr:hypothetical protein [Bacteroidia bacterium]
MRIVVFVLLLTCTKVFSQLPETELFLANVEIKNNLIKVKGAEKITAHKGYNNQPSFIDNDDKILFTSDFESSNKTHIWSYNVKNKKTERLSITNTSEYSAALLPNQKDFSAVMVEEDSTQRIWTFDLLKGGNKSCLSQQTDSVGYYTWLGKDSILYYKLTSPHSLHALNIKTNQDVWLCNNPTRSFKKVSSTTFFYVIHDETQNNIYLFDVHTKKATPFAIDNISANQDYIWHPTLGLLKSEVSKIYRYSTDTKVWAELADFSSFGLKKITRFSISATGKYIALVSNL